MLKANITVTLTLTVQTHQDPLNVNVVMGTRTQVVPDAGNVKVGCVILPCFFIELQFCLNAKVAEVRVVKMLYICF